MPPHTERGVWSRRQLLAGASAGVGALFLAACSGSKPAPAPSSSGAAAPAVPTATVPVPTGTPSVVREVTSYGAVGDGHTDDTKAISTALAALAAGEALHFPAGTYCHSAVLKVTTERVSLTGGGTLLATDEAQSAVQIEAAGVTVNGLTFGVASTTKRWSTPDQHKLFLGEHDGIVVNDVTITGSAAAGLFCLGTSNFVLQNVHVSDTRADGIHMTDGAHQGSVRSPLITRSGDDGVAVVSYLDDADLCHDITITAPTVRTTTGGRGLSVVGGHNIVYSDISVDSSYAAGVYIACEGGSSVTHNCSAVSVSGGTVTDANTNAGIDHGAVLVYSGRSDGGVSDVTVSGLTVTGTRAGASRQIGVIADNGNPVSAIRFQDLRLAANPTPYQGNAPTSAFTITGTTAAGAAVEVPQ